MAPPPPDDARRESGAAPLRPGKIPPDLLQRVVFAHLGARRPEVLVRAGIGRDCAAVDLGEAACVVTCDPITAASHHLGRLAVHVACNDLATTGAEPVALLLTLLLREGTTPEDLEAIVAEAGRTAATLGVEIVGGHTEVTPGIDRTLAVVTALGRAPRGAVLAAGARPHDAVILTKGAAIEGTAILAADLAERLRPVLGEEGLARARAFIERISVVPEGLIAARAGASALHDVTEGGVLAGAWELAEASGRGIVLRADDVPVLPETQAICHALDLDPLALIGSGAMLICTSDPRGMLRALAEEGIPAAEVGVITDGDRVVVRGGRARPLVPPERDEIYRVFEPPAGA
ncbi:MAG: AIR synthase family protein [Armatimonadota bacterium]|nr:AIR synthase family protein [Armatimonadota bacterium]MDR7400685.1 AIR synthase family protein [Armatimonadota bacterium]MDR7403618.1 AIR synthase family protein [Armatimonadota bacterium]MDR7436504.1 AIR synthase family protein [Armatimonadota bacterium]MDR7472539.1 AIR synthase family protein [Armatimonadota bacterium]